MEVTANLVISVALVTIHPIIKEPESFLYFRLHLLGPFKVVSKTTRNKILREVLHLQLMLVHSTIREPQLRPQVEVITPIQNRLENDRYWVLS